MIEFEGVFEEDDLYKLFSKSPNKASEKTVNFHQLKALLRKTKFTDETRFYHLFGRVLASEQPDGSRTRATVTQKNLFRVASVMDATSAGSKMAIAIQYLGRKER